VERRALVAEALLAGAESAEVLGGLGDNVVKEVEVDATGLLCGERRVNAKLYPTATATGTARCRYMVHEVMFLEKGRGGPLRHRLSPPSD
jgi:hypothetical protein